MITLRQLDNARALLARVDESLGKRRPVSNAETSLLKAYRMTLGAEIDAGHPKPGTLRTVRSLLLRRESLVMPPRLTKRMRWLARRAETFIHSIEDAPR